MEILGYDIFHDDFLVTGDLKCNAGFLSAGRIMPGRSGGKKIRWEEKVVRLAGFEPTTPGSASQCSNPLSYKRILAVSYQR